MLYIQSPKPLPMGFRHAALLLAVLLCGSALLVHSEEGKPVPERLSPPASFKEFKEAKTWFEKSTSGLTLSCSYDWLPNNGTRFRIWIKREDPEKLDAYFVYIQKSQDAEIRFESSVQCDDEVITGLNAERPPTELTSFLSNCNAPCALVWAKDILSQEDADQAKTKTAASIFGYQVRRMEDVAFSFQLLSHPEERVRMAGVVALENLEGRFRGKVISQEEVLESFKKLAIEDPSEGVRRFALTTFRYAVGVDAKSVFIKALSDQAPRVQLEALTALSQSKDSDLIPHLVNIIEKGDAENKEVTRNQILAGQMVEHISGQPFNFRSIGFCGLVPPETIKIETEKAGKLNHEARKKLLSWWKAQKEGPAPSK